MVVLRRGKAAPNTPLLTGTPPHCFRHRRRSALSSPRPLDANVLEVMNILKWLMRLRGMRKGGGET